MEVRHPLVEAAAHARRAERLGYHGLSVPEAVHDGMLVAQGAWGLQRLSGGRFELGLGSQVKGNLEGRFGVVWTPPAPRMRDYVRALRAVFARWQDGTPLAFESAHYRHPRLPVDCDRADRRRAGGRARGRPGDAQLPVFDAGIAKVVVRLRSA